MLCPVSIYYAGMGCHVLCLHTMMVCNVMSSVYILCWDGVPCPVSTYYDGLGCYVQSVYILCWDGVSCPVSTHYDGL